MTPQVLVRYLERYIVYSMTPQVLVRYLEKFKLLYSIERYILLKYWSDT